jgi:hypothetical protein
MSNPIDDARRIYEARFGRRVGSIASIGGMLGAGLAGAARYEGWLAIPFELIAMAFGGAMLAGPLVARIGRLVARRRVSRAIGAGGPAAPEVRACLEARALATAEDVRSFGWSAANTAVLAIVGWLWIFGLATGSILETVGKALSYLVATGGPSIALFALAAYLHGRSMAKSDQRKRELASSGAILAAMVVPAFTVTSVSGLLAFAIASLYIGIAGAGVMAPALIYMRRVSRRERQKMGHLALPAADEDAAMTKKILLSALEWEDGPEPFRADALRGLSARLPHAEVVAHLDRSLAIGKAELLRAALELCKKTRHRPDLDRLVELARTIRTKDAALLPPLLHRHRDPVVITTLLELLERDDPEVVSAAADSLGLVGSFDVIPRLKAVARAGGRIAEVAIEAVERIRIRHGGSPGQLSVVTETEGGALSEPSESGAVSLRLS